MCMAIGHLPVRNCRRRGRQSFASVRWDAITLPEHRTCCQDHEKAGDPDHPDLEVQNRHALVPVGTMEWNFRRGPMFGEILVAGDPPDGVVIAYRATEPAVSDERVAASIGDVRTRVGEAEYNRMKALFVAADALLVAALPGPHWYVDMLAVEPAREPASEAPCWKPCMHTP